MDKDTAKILALQQQQLAEAMRTNSLLTMIQMTLEAQAALFVDLSSETSGPRAQIIREFEERRSAMFEELKKKSIEDRERISDALAEVLYGSGTPQPRSSEEAPEDDRKA
jgi:hypothetical protein